jgi:hypothetical protein
MDEGPQRATRLPLAADVRSMQDLPPLKLVPMAANAQRVIPMLSYIDVGAAAQLN